MEADFSREVTEVGNVHLVALQGELDIATAQGLADWLVEISGSAVVVDLSGVTFMDSTGLTALATARQRMAEKGDDLLLTRPTPIVRRVLEVMGLAQWIKPWDSRWQDQQPGGASATPVRPHPSDTKL
ncbi:MAG TPA: STAS domain-containing protein [Acidimicrobiales bacterium]|nr:STAS domain-containing protein [Acidimicrobiales bacterium]